MPKRGKDRRWHRRLALVLVIAAVISALVARRSHPRDRVRHAQELPRDPNLVLVTGYCNCGKCCGWRKSWFGLGEPVYDYGPMKGKPKRVGITATGTIAKKGTIAADPKVFKFGTRLTVPGYGQGTVEDVGGSIRGRHIDLWFPTHAEAMHWGRRYLKLTSP